MATLIRRKRSRKKKKGSLALMAKPGPNRSFQTPLLSCLLDARCKMMQKPDLLLTTTQPPEMSQMDLVR
jgi:hypothetical protein